MSLFRTRRLIIKLNPIVRFWRRLWGRTYNRPVLEDGALQEDFDGTYVKCPVCQQSVPHKVRVFSSTPEELLDLRHCITGSIEKEGGQLHVQCTICGMPLRDAHGNIRFQNVS